MQAYDAPSVIPDPISRVGRVSQRRNPTIRRSTPPTPDNPWPNARPHRAGERYNKEEAESRTEQREGERLHGVSVEHRTDAVTADRSPPPATGVSGGARKTRGQAPAPRAAQLPKLK